MPEIKKKLIKLSEGSNYRATGEAYVITEDHSLFDVLMFIVDQSSLSGLKCFVEQLGKESK